MYLDTTVILGRYPVPVKVSKLLELADTGFKFHLLR